MSEFKSVQNIGNQIFKAEIQGFIKQQLTTHRSVINIQC